MFIQSVEQRAFCGYLKGNREVGSLGRALFAELETAPQTPETKDWFVFGLHSQDFCSPARDGKSQNGLLRYPVTPEYHRGRITPELFGEPPSWDSVLIRIEAQDSFTGGVVQIHSHPDQSEQAADLLESMKAQAAPGWIPSDVLWHQPVGPHLLQPSEGRKGGSQPRAYGRLAPQWQHHSLPHSPKPVSSEPWPRQRISAQRRGRCVPRPLLEHSRPHQRRKELSRVTSRKSPETSPGGRDPARRGHQLGLPNHSNRSL